MPDVKDTKELVEGLGSIIVIIVKQFKDGVQVEDIPAVLAALASDPDFQAGVQGIKNIPAEIANLDFFESIEVGRSFLKILPKIITAIKG